MRHWKRVGSILVLLATIGLGSGFALLWYMPYLFTPLLQGEVVVTLTDDGFVPEKIQVGKGQIVTFTTTRNEPFWPASNQHPSHGEWSNFDPKRALDPDESWSFTFDRVGVWNFHDHLNARFRGTIEVFGIDGSTKTDCLNRDGTRGIGLAKCWEGDFTKVMEEGGVAAAFTLFNTLLREDTLFQSNCHDVMHIVGAKAYAEYQKTGTITNGPETSSCGFGFYHGFIDTMSINEGDFQKSREYCEALETSEQFQSTSMAFNAAQGCRHGIGHAILDSLEGSDWGNGAHMLEIGIAGCESIFPDKADRIACSTGVSNALAIAYANSYFNLSFEIGDHYQNCATLATHYQTGCYIEMAIHYTDTIKLTPEETIASFYVDIPEASLPETIEAYGLQFTQLYSNKEDFLKEAQALCSDITPTTLQKNCHAGIVIGLIRSNDKDSYTTEALDYCNLYEGITRQDCAKELVGMFRVFMTKPDFELVCATVQPEFDVSCAS